MDIVVTGIGLRSALGNLTDSWSRLIQGKSGIQLHRPFNPFRPLPLGMMGKEPSSLNPLIHLIVQDALQDAQLTAPLTTCGVVIGSSRGCQGLWEQMATPPYAITTNWLETFPHQGAIATVRQIGSQEIALSPMAACATGILAISQGCDLIRQGRCERAIAGAIEVPITPLTLAGFQQMGALAKTGCYPFDQQREGLALGEGGAVFILESAEVANKRNAKSYGTIKGWGFSCDASHVSAPAEDNCSAQIAIKQCLQRSDLSPNDVQFIHAHGTGTQLNDRREAALIQSLFAKTIAVTSSKGATGHTLGASGALSVAFSLMALKNQRLSPCVGLNQTEFRLNLVRESQQAHINHALCLSFGFGGQNAAIALGRSLWEE
ncbi:MAG: beta-ketoacyl-ACP synthase [Snowella sp.]|nr:beta-ketoacyl-ACP synthase [Snowella sp.]